MKKLQVYLMFAFIFVAISVNYINKHKIIARKDNLVSANKALIDNEKKDANPATSFATVKSNSNNPAPSRPNPCDVYAGNTRYPNLQCDCEAWSVKDPNDPNWGMEAFVKLQKMSENKQDILASYMDR